MFVFLNFFFSNYVLCCSTSDFLYLFPISVTPCWCEIRYKECENDRIAAEESSRKLGQQVAEKEVQNSSIEGDLRIEREWRTSLQETVVKDRDKISELHQELAQLKSVASVSLFIFFLFVPVLSPTICIKNNIFYGLNVSFYDCWECISWKVKTIIIGII